MILNCAERLVVNNPLRMAMQRLEMVWFLQAADLSPNPRILEIGCGRGAGARILLKKMHPRRIEALDLDPVMMHTAKGFLTSKERERISLLAGDSTRLPFHSASFDVVFGFGLLHHVPDWESAVKEVARVLKPGGRYYMEELYPPLYLNAVTRRVLLHPTQNRFHSRDLKAALSRAGLFLHAFLESGFLGILGVTVR
ncbi:MAG: class I SAM-dependent methyltransferase [Deltaproteobacteria bacterium]|nr:class I SAM-dependent methyltransferase [Deltaproteobacteria bacterium]